MKRRRIWMSFILLGGLVLTSCSNDTASNITAIKLSRSYISINVDETFLLEATPIGGEKTVTFFSADSSIASIDANGLIKGIAPGETSVYAIANDKVGTCLVKVENPAIQTKTAIRTGSLAINIESEELSYNGSVFNAPLTFTYQTKGYTFDEDDPKAYFDLEFTKGIASEGISEIEQANKNIEFISSILNYDNSTISTLLNLPKKSRETRALGYAYNKLVDTGPVSDEHFVAAFLNDRFFVDAYSVKDGENNPRASEEYVFEDDETMTLVKSIISAVKLIDLSGLSLLKFDLVTILSNIFDGPTSIIDDNSSSIIQQIGRTLAAIIYVFAGYTNLDYKPLIVDGYKGANLHFYLNDNAKNNITSIIDIIPNLVEEGNPVWDYVKEFSINDFALDLNIYRDDKNQNYNHISSLEVNLDVKTPNSDSNKFTTSLNLSTETTYEKATAISELYNEHNARAVVQKEVNTYMEKIGDVISYNDKDGDSKDFSILPEKLANARLAINQFSSLSNKARFMIIEECFSKTAIDNLYKKAEAAFTASKLLLLAISENSSMLAIKAVVELINEYKDYKEALKDANKNKFDVACSVINKHLDSVQNRIIDSTNSLKAASLQEDSLDIINDAIVNYDIFDNDGDISNLMDHTFIVITVKATYGEDMMLTDEVNEKRLSIIDTEEKRDENDELVPGLYALSHYSREALKKAANLLVQNNEGDEIFNTLKIKDNDNKDTNFGLLVKMAQKQFTTSYITANYSLTSMLEAEHKTKLRNAFSSLEETNRFALYDVLVNYKNGSLTKEESKNQVNAIKSTIEEIDEIQNIFLGQTEQINLSTINQMIEDINVILEN